MNGSAPQPLDAEASLGRLRWACRRGMRELDVLMSRYLERDFPRASSGERDAFVQLLGLQDPQLAGYLIAGEAPADPELAAVVARIREP
ncbi:MAG: succinate dehydrogenase assembly factor 2 [Steroidobacteraceae bacterium]|jgi:antitoxin CptB|nr:succinate dehydrogenase assembly factor 2 [Steroidobacteraceae bacterium]